MINQDEIELIHAANKECDRLKEAIRLRSSGFNY